MVVPVVRGGVSDGRRDLDVGQQTLRRDSLDSRGRTGPCPGQDCSEPLGYVFRGSSTGSHASGGPRGQRRAEAPGGRS
jgi:hypothetical protein